MILQKHESYPDDNFKKCASGPENGKKNIKNTFYFFL